MKLDTGRFVASTSLDRWCDGASIDKQRSDYNKTNTQNSLPACRSFSEAGFVISV